MDKKDKIVGHIPLGCAIEVASTIEDSASVRATWF
jgi:hypothetical protein